MSTLGVMTDIYVHLTTDTGATTVYGLTGGRVHNLIGPVDGDLPMLTFQAIDDPPIASFGQDNLRMLLQVDVYTDASAGATTALTINDAMFTQSHRVEFASETDFSKISMGCIDRGRPVVEDGAVRITSQYTVFGVE